MTETSVSVHSLIMIINTVSKITLKQLLKKKSSSLLRKAKSIISLLWKCKINGDYPHAEFEKKNCLHTYSLKFLFCFGCYSTIGYMVCLKFYLSHYTWHAVTQLYTPKELQNTIVYIMKSGITCVFIWQSLHHEIWNNLCFHLAKLEFKAMGWSEIEIEQWKGVCFPVNWLKNV